MTAADARARRVALFAKTSTPVLLESARVLEAVVSPTPDQRMARAWLFDELEQRAGGIQSDEELRFEEVYDASDSYLTALLTLRPQLLESVD